MSWRISKWGKVIFVLLGLGPVMMALLNSFAIPWATLGAYSPIMWIGGGAFLLAETLGEDIKQLKRKDPLVVIELLTAVSWLVIGMSVMSNWNFILDAIAGYHAMFLGLGVIFIVFEIYSEI